MLKPWLGLKILFISEIDWVTRNNASTEAGTKQARKNAIKSWRRLEEKTWRTIES